MIVLSYLRGFAGANELQAKDLIGLAGLLVTIGSLLVAQLRANKIAKDAEAISKAAELRKTYKLKIYQMLLDSGPLSLGDLTRMFQDRNPNDEASGSEIRKSVYEMVVDKTVIAFDDATFGADSVSVKESQNRRKLHLRFEAMSAWQATLAPQTLALLPRPRRK